MRIAWVSPVASSHALRSAAYTAHVLQHLPDDVQVEVFCDDADLRNPRAPELSGLRRAGIPVFHFHRSAERAANVRFDAWVYQFEDHAACGFVARCAKLRPGLCCFHDLNLNRLYYSQFSHSTAAKDINEMMDREFGEHSFRLGDYHVRRWSTAAFDRLYPCGRSEIRSAAALAVFNGAAMRAVRAMGLRTPLSLCSSAQPAPSISEPAREKLRTELLGETEAGERAFVLVFSAGELLRDRAAVFFDVFSELRRSGANLRAVWLAASEQLGEAAEAWLKKSLEAQDRAAVQVAVLTPELYRRGVYSLGDAFVSLRCDTLRGWPSGLLESLAAGVPVIAAEQGPAADLPPACALRLSAGLEQREELSAVLQELLHDKRLCRSLGENGKQYGRCFCAPGIAAQDVFLFVREQLGVIAERSGEQETQIAAAQKSLLSELRLDLSGRSLTGQEAAERRLDLWETIAGRAAHDFNWQSSEVD